MQYPRGTADTENVRRRRAITLLSLAALLLASPLAEAREPRPYVKSVSPLSVSVGEVMTIKGFYFTPGYPENVVVFVARDGRVSYVRSEHSTKRSMTADRAEEVERILTVSDGIRKPTKFRIKVISTLDEPPREGRALRSPDRPRRRRRLRQRRHAEPTDTDDDNDCCPTPSSTTAKTNACLARQRRRQARGRLGVPVGPRPEPQQPPVPRQAALPERPIRGRRSSTSTATASTRGPSTPCGSATARRYPLNDSDGDQHTVDEPVSEHPLERLLPARELSDDERDFDNDGISNIFEYGRRFEPWKDFPGHRPAGLPWTRTPTATACSTARTTRTTTTSRTSGARRAPGR